MALENKVANLIKLLSEKEKTFFAITCIERIVELYKQFDLAEDISEAEPSIPKGEAYKTLLSIFKFIKEDLEMADSEEIQNQIDKCEPLIVNYNIFDTTLINTVAQLVAESVSLVLDYALYNDDDKIINCSENNLEILNQIKSDEYRLNINPDATRMEVQSFLVPIFEREIETQEKIIDYIKNKVDKKVIQEFIQKSKIQ